MLSFAADENFNIHIVNGVLRRLPTADILRLQDANVWQARIHRPLRTFPRLGLALGSSIAVPLNASGCGDRQRKAVQRRRMP